MRANTTRFRAVLVAHIAPAASLVPAARADSGNSVLPVAYSPTQVSYRHFFLTPSPSFPSFPQYPLSVRIQHADLSGLE